MALALPPEAWERDALTVEVRIHWGATILAVHHLEPGRSFSLGDAAADFAIDLPLEKTRRFQLLVARRGETWVVVPPGIASSLLTSSAQASTLAEALADGRARPHDDASGAHAIRLAPGVSIRLELPARARGSSYRTAGADEEPGADSLVFEVAAVRAGGRVDRGHFKGQARLAASCLVVAALTASALLALEFAPRSFDAQEAAESDQRYEIYTLLRAAEEHELDPIEQLVRNPRWRASGDDDGAWAPPPDIVDEDLLDAWTTTDLLQLDRTQLAPCLRYTLPDRDPDREVPPFPIPIAAVCTSPVLGPMGLPGLGEPLPTDPALAQRRPSAFWSQQIADPATLRYRVLRSAHELKMWRVNVDAPPPGPVQITVKTLHGEANEEVALREVRARRGAIQRCIDLDPPYMRRGELVIVLQVDSEGVASPPPFQIRTAYGLQGPPPPWQQEYGAEIPGRCLVGALAEIHLGASSPFRTELEVTLRSPRKAERR
ncbi:MAG: hypothetical protein ABJE95_12895 [Byssovorax sp.]